MHLHLEGSSELKVDRATAYQRLTDLEIVAKALPDSEDVKIIDSDTGEATVKLHGARLDPFENEDQDSVREVTFTRGAVSGGARGPVAI